MPALDDTSLLASRGVPRDVAGKNALDLLTAPPRVWVILHGTVDLFAARLANGAPTGPREHLARMRAGEALFSFEPPDAIRAGLSLTAAGSIGANVIEFSREEFQHLAAEPDAAPHALQALDAWIARLTEALTAARSPKESRPLKHGPEVLFDAAWTLRPQAETLWVRPLEGVAYLLGRNDLGPLPPAVHLPVARSGWIVTETAGRAHNFETAEILAEDPTLTGLDAFHRMIAHAIIFMLQDAAESSVERFVRRREADTQSIHGSLLKLGSILNPNISKDAADHDDPLAAACSVVVSRLGGRIVTPPGLALLGSKEKLMTLADASNMRVREVALFGGWWRGDSGPLIGYMADDGRPVALTPASARSYHLFDPQTGQTLDVTEAVASHLAPFGHTLYLSFPKRALGARDIIAFGLKGIERDVLTIVLMGAGSGLLALITPLATGAIFDLVIPGARINVLLQLGLLMLTTAVAIFVFQITRDTAMLRLEGKLEERLQSALWDRLLNLPVGFFRRFSSGDLANRAQGISGIRKILSGSTITAILGGAFSIFNVPLMFYFQPALATIATGMTFFAVAVIGVLSYIKVNQQRKLSQIDGIIQGFVLEFLTGIAKFRATGSERRALGFWARRFAQQKEIAYKTGIIGAMVETFIEIFPVISLFTIFFVVSGKLGENSTISTGSFLGFNAAYIQFLMASLAMSRTFVTALNAIPLFERCRPILEEMPEVTDDKVDVGELTGDIEIAHVSFRYKKDGPLILDDVSLRVRPGEFAALVGPSGSGKSTLFRLLLGFDQPSDGAIFYDGKDLSTLDVRSVRKRLGVALQNGELLGGTIFENIAGASLSTIEDAWEAARLAGLDGDIKAMPMGMHTIIPQGGGTLSGGQRQRVLIARALIGKPSILYFDEATSALDNKTQAVVSQSLEQLKTTRIVIAHRLSTIINADTIHLLEGGKVRESGSYQSLMKLNGAFAELARRQMA